MATSRGNQLAQEIFQKLAVLKQVCQGVDENLASCAPADRWSPKQILSHLSGPEGLGHLPIFRAFLDSDIPIIDLDTENPFFTETRARMSFSELVAECAMNYQRVANFAAELSDAQLARKAHIPKLKDSPLGEYPTLDGMINGLGEYHVQFHIDHLREIMEALSMNNYNIAVIVGSLRLDSFNRKLANAIVKLAPPNFSFKQLQISDLPLYNQDDDSNPAESVKRLKSEIKAVQGILFVTAEYNRSIPGVLKNAIDHASRPYGQSAWAGKPAGITGASVGAIGTAMAQQHLRNVLSYLDVPTMGQPEAFVHAKEGLFDADGSIGAASKEFFQNWMDTYVAWVKKHAS